MAPIELAYFCYKIIEVKLKDIDMSDEDTQGILQKVTEWSGSSSSGGGAASAYGISLNLGTREIVVIRTLSAQDPAEVGDASRDQVLTEIAEVAVVERMVAQVGPMPL
ncbi:hypothetical protein PG996_015619 [Apiospora saccharicola]|uniref:Uncharacterized protein n=1 Tax=Apiospora saccharicola TaxID=335842 RepID=A0ABR1TNT3_9PEZI